MTTTTNPPSEAKRRSKGGAKDSSGLLAFAGVACIACCIGPIMGFLGGVTILGVASTTFIGIGGLLIAAMTIAAAIIVLRRRRASRCATGTVPETVPVEVTSRNAKTSASR